MPLTMETKDDQRRPSQVDLGCALPEEGHSFISPELDDEETVVMSNVDKRPSHIGNREKLQQKGHVSQEARDARDRQLIDMYTRKRNRPVMAQPRRFAATSNETKQSSARSLNSESPEKFYPYYDLVVTDPSTRSDGNANVGSIVDKEKLSSVSEGHEVILPPFSPRKQQQQSSLRTSSNPRPRPSTATMRTKAQSCPRDFNPSSPPDFNPQRSPLRTSSNPRPRMSSAVTRAKAQSCPRDFNPSSSQDFNPQQPSLRTSSNPRPRPSTSMENMRKKAQSCPRDFNPSIQPDFNPQQPSLRTSSNPRPRPSTMANMRKKAQSCPRDFNPLLASPRDLPASPSPKTSPSTIGIDLTLSSPDQQHHVIVPPFGKAKSASKLSTHSPHHLKQQQANARKEKSTSNLTGPLPPFSPRKDLQGSGEIKLHEIVPPFSPSSTADSSVSKSSDHKVIIPPFSPAKNKVPTRSRGMIRAVGQPGQLL